MRYQVLRGMKDILPTDSLKWEFVELTFRFICGLYNYSEIRTPILEPTEVFVRSIGQNTDIVSKEMYTFTDRGDRSITLRPEATASVVRSVLENNLITPDQVSKFYYLGPMFRYERPQAGRLRQFHQAGVEVFGAEDPFLDVEVIDLAVNYFNNLGLKNLGVEINCVGCQLCRPDYIKGLKENLENNLEKLCEDCQARFERNPLRILDCKNHGCQKYILATPAILEFLCAECKNHFEKVIEGLEILNISFKVNNRMVRGLDYYTRTTFEVTSADAGSQNAVCGGGRYDNLVKEFGGSQIPAVGFAVGLDRLLSVMENQKIEIPIFKKSDLFIATLGESARKKGFELLKNCRNQGLRAEMDYFGKSLKSQMRIADRIRAKFVLILGDDEIKKGIAVLKRMADGTQEELALDQILGKLRGAI